ncbi:uncharacterized protein LOC121967135 [Zingiber officinale]|uniref:uncharacterized protein LOC121967135 n=1 Tax=Zingiber officinale TaxID=94328 RepID=UPI001C4CFAF5|nr:uncharacterized protein LOC121967135 [Zingiber officinale]
MEHNGSGDACPAQAFRYNETLCACNPGRYLVNGSCVMFDTGGEWVVSSGVSPSTSFLTTVLPVDSITRFTQSQAVLLEATLVLLLIWLVFCFALRFARFDGRSFWSLLRWWISRFDMFYATNHWLDDNKVVIKRKTELGGTFSIASWILFLGLLSALLYQIITKRNIEVHKIRPANAPDLLSFVNDLEFNITTISSMSCSNFRGPDSLLVGTPGFIDYRVLPLSVHHIQYNCQNTSSGPSLSIKCNNCPIPRRDYYISWQFIDLPNHPATAVGFQFNLSAKDHADNRHVSFVSGAMTSDNFTIDEPKTFRGSEVNILKIHLFPMAYNKLNNLKLIQPVFHDFISGSSFSVASDLQASLGTSKDGLVNTTLYISSLSDYIVEINNENMIGIVGFFADVGGLYVFSLIVFLCLLIQCEARIKKLHYEDVAMRDILRQRRAQKNWDKLRKFVMYTWSSNNVVMDSNKSERHDSLTSNSSRGIQTLHKQPSRNFTCSET